MTASAYLETIPVKSYVRARDLPGSPEASRAALSRAAKDGKVVKAARGLYFKGPKTRFGMARPNTLDTALEVLGKEGIGPCGFSAARAFGLTTQVPAKVELAISGPAPEGLDGVKLHTRNNPARRKLSYLDIALLEVLREPAVIESGWTAFVSAAKRSVKEKRIHPDLIAAAVPRESPDVRRRWSELTMALAA
ncbi:hypothetical protein GCM10009784_08140 [Arthrobacter parietis]|uniref:Transcriptional regulator, AbiEi antitoxin, Type IV TA system n=2 Tax=Arthrobacter parietis TaxID=271434 RepID=A0ABN3ARP1_9MICC